MIICVDSEGSIEIENPHDFKGFSVKLREARSQDAVAANFAGPEAVVFAGQYAWVSERQLRAMPSLQDDPLWKSGLDGMVAFAREKSWFDPDSGRIRAHVEYD